MASRSNGTYVLRDAPSDIVLGRPSRPPSEPSEVQDSNGVHFPPPPPTPRESFIRETPAGSAIRDLVRDFAQASPADCDALLPRMERFAPDALASVLGDAFPGPTWVSKQAARRRLPTATELSGIATALVVLKSAAHPTLVWLLQSQCSDRRFFAALVAAEVPSESLLEPLARMTLGSDAQGRQAAVHALEAHMAVPGYADTMAWIRATSSDVRTRQVWRVRGLATLAGVGDAQALPVMIQCLGDRDRTIARAAHKSLRKLTCHDLGTMRLPWKGWARAHGLKPRMQWLIDALADRRGELRIMAARELERLTGQSFGVEYDAGRRAFLDAQAKYAAWWQRRPLA